MKIITKLGLIALSMTSLTFATTDNLVKKQQEIESKIDSVKVKEGIEFGGQFRSEFIRSKIDGNGMNDEFRQREDITYTQVDFDIKARPNTSTTARVIMRMHADWPTFFGSLNNPVTTRWISLDGKIGDYTWYHLGDLKTKWSEYSIWSDNTNQLYEPYIFTEQRSQQMNEAFLGDNYRPVQGINLKSALKIGKIDYLGVDILGARLRTAFMPKDAPTSTTAKNLVVSSFESAEMDKYLIGGKLDVEAYNVGIFGSYNATIESPLTAKYSITAPIATSNISLGANFAIDKMLGMDALLFEPKGEFAMSNYSVDTVGGKFVHKNFIGDVEGDNNASAMTVGTLLGYNVKKTVNVKVDFGYVNNDPHFRNDMTQSPEFIPQQILNTDNNSTKDEHYTYFDARYHGAYKSVTKQNTERGVEYLPYPTSKLAYTNMVLTAEESGVFNAQTSEKAYLQPFTPFAYGASTPNLNGIKLNADIGILDNKAEVSGYFSNISEIEASVNNIMTENLDTAGNISDTSYATYNWNTAKFTNFGGGLKLHVDKFLSIDRVIRLSGAYEGATATRIVGTLVTGDDIGNSIDKGEMDLTSSLINLGLYVNLIPKLSLLGGYQIFSNKDETVSMDRKDTHSLVGLEYKVNKGAYLLVESGFIDHTDNKDDANNFSQNLIMTKIKVNF